MSNEPSTAKKAVTHVKKYKKVYGVLALTGGAYYLGARNATVVDTITKTVVEKAKYIDIDALKKAGVDDYLADLYRSGMIPVTMDLDAYKEFAKAMVKSGSYSEALREDSVSDAIALLDFYKTN